MKVCVICLAMKAGAMILYASQLANSLAKNNDVYAIISESIEETKYFEKKVNILQIPILPKNFVSLDWFRVDKIIRLIKNTNPDIIHITVEHPLQIPIVFLKNYPLILTCHDVKVHPGDIKNFFEFLALLSKQILKRNADKIIIHGEKLKDQMIDGGQLANKIEVIPHGDYSFFTKYKKDNVEEENAVLFFGRIMEYKGIEYLIKAEPWITKRFYNIKIIIAGRGNFSKYENLIEHKKNFEIINKFIPDEEVAELFQRAKIVALPYIEASQSGIIPIAYAFKKPVVVTDVGSIPEVVDNEKTGFIVPSRDEKALANAIILLLKDDKLRNEMGKNAYKKMKEELSWDKIAEKTVEVYEKAIEDKTCK